MIFSRMEDSRRCSYLAAILLLSLTLSRQARALSADESNPEPPPTANTVAPPKGFQDPELLGWDGLAVQALYAYVDPLQLVPRTLRDRALAYFHLNRRRIANKNYLTVVDFSKHSSLPRLFILNMKTGSALPLHVAHGKGSDRANSGFATRFSNQSGSEASSLGFYLTAETYSGGHGYSLRLDGLSRTNSRVRAREVVLHGATYVYDSNLQAGRSWGCFAVPMDERDRVIQMIKGGSLIYAGLGH